MSGYDVSVSFRNTTRKPFANENKQQPTHYTKFKSRNNYDHTSIQPSFMKQLLLPIYTTYMYHLNAPHNIKQFVPCPITEY
jgi:hypothetical protein